MTLLGPLAVAVAVACAILATRAPSPVVRRLRSVGGAPSRPRPFVRTVARMVRSTSRSEGEDRLVTVKLAGALIGALAGAGAGAVAGAGVIVAPLTAYGGFVLPSLVVERRAAGRRRDGERAAIAIVEWLHALVACGRPLESALVGLTAHATGSPALDECLARVRRDYTLGVPISTALARNGAESGIAALVELATRVERARDLGRGVLGLLQDLRDELRADERARGLEVASQVEGKLTLVLTLCYLPALAVLVIIPLFLTLLSGLLGT